jgi:hypothetical protein
MTYVDAYLLWVGAILAVFWTGFAVGRWAR